MPASRASVSPPSRTLAFPPPGSIARFSDRVVAHDLPALPADRRAQTVAFAGRRIALLPSPIKLGVGIVAIVVDGVGGLVGLGRLVGLLAARPLPLLGEYVRLVRSLTYAYVWDTWPDTEPDGAPSGVLASR
jgi:hypothetical protein